MPNDDKGEVAGQREVEKKPLIPGSVTIRPTRSDAEDNKAAFCRLLVSVRDSGVLTNEKIAEIIGHKSSNPAQNISKRIREESFSDPEKERFLRHVFHDNKYFSGPGRKQLGGIDDAFYFAFLNEFGTQETSQDNARAQIVGTYKLFRFSVEHDDEFVFGKLIFSEDEKSHAVKVRMYQPKHEKEGLRPTMESASGYLFRVSQMYLIILRDELTNDFRATLFPRFKFDFVGTDVNPQSIFAGRQKHLVHLDGFGLGIDGSSGFFSPVYLSLVDDVSELLSLDEKMDILPNIPDRVRRKLERNGPLRRL